MDGALRFEYHIVPDAANHSISRPSGTGRSVYEAAAGEVLYFDAEDLFYIDYVDRVRLLVDPEAGSASASIVESERENLWLLSRPMFTLPLIELLKRRGLFSVHAAGLKIDRSGLLVAGSTGSGKSTLALALLLDGLEFLGDDMVFLSPEHERVRAQAFPDEIDLTEQSAAFFPQLGPLAPTRPGWPKHQLSAAQAGAKVAAGCTPKVLVFPRIEERERSAVEALSDDEALLELAPNVLLTEAGSSQRHLDALAALVRQCECHRLAAGRDLESQPALLRELF